MATLKVRKAVGAVIFQNDEYLLVHKVKNVDSKENIVGHWDFPKGGVQEADKDLETAILRELKEETGSNNYRIIKNLTRKYGSHFQKLINMICKKQ